VDKGVQTMRAIARMAGRPFFVWRLCVAALLRENAVPVASSARPTVIVGSGPVGVRVAQELARLAPQAPLVLYGAEQREPYNRVRLTAYLTGELSWDALTRDLRLAERIGFETRLGCPVVTIDRAARTVRDAAGRIQAYGALVLATGSTPYVPEIPGVRLAGVFTFRDFEDAQALFARSVRSRRTVVLGGGLLGLEAARAMRRFNTEVLVVEQEPQLMPQQLDEPGAALLHAHVARLGIEVVTGNGVRKVLGDTRVSGIQLRSGARIECDTLIVATGIRPNIGVARNAGLAVGRAIRVDDSLRTSDPSIYAVGECAEHREVVYGLVAPGLEQATVVASLIAGREARYLGSTSATRLKVLELPVFSIGRVRGTDRLDLARQYTYRAPDGGAYGKILIERGRLIGAIVVGDAPNIGRLQEAVMRNRRMLPWQCWRFAHTGSPWPEAQLASVLAWPDAVAVCNCTGVTRGQLGQALATGCATADALAAATGASTVCGSCRPLLAELAGHPAPVRPVRGAKALLAAGSAALGAALAATAFDVPYPKTVQLSWMWDVLWRDPFWKQASGFSVLVLSALALLLSLRKRIRRFAAGDFALWRVVHAVLAALTLAGLAAHTGGRFGANLNLMLMTSFLGVISLGAVAGGVAALEHRMGPRGALLRRSWTRAHLLLFWPVPMLLGLHIFKTYYF
jgi:nitrite reductase (NADH) large subunit